MKRTICLFVFTIALTVQTNAMTLLLQKETNGVYFERGGLELTYPTAHVSVNAQYDAWKGNGLLGADTRLARYGIVDLNFGIATSFERDCFPVGSVNFNILKLWTNRGLTSKPLADIALYYGQDLDDNRGLFGLKTTLNLW